METMLESEAMAILVGAGVSYGRREAALRAAGGALAILEEPEAYAAQLQARGVALVRRAWTDRARMLDELERKGMALVPRGDEYVFDMAFDGDKIVMCPMAGENGCALGDEKPFDCRVWPFRVNDLAGRRVITVSPVCRAVFALPLETLVQFLNEDGFADMLFSTARLHPDIVKPYMDGYPILAVEKTD